MRTEVEVVRGESRSVWRKKEGEVVMRDDEMRPLRRLLVDQSWFSAKRRAR